MNTWKIEEYSPDFENNLLKETVFSLGNGYFGSRGYVEEGCGKGIKSSKGTFVNGFYESLPIRYGEWAYGYAKNNQIMLNIPNMFCFDIHVDSERICFGSTRILSHNRFLDMKSGFTGRETVYEIRSGMKISISVRKLISLVHKNIGAFEVTVKMLEGQGNIAVKTGFEMDVSNIEHENDPRIGADLAGGGLDVISCTVEDDIFHLLQKTRNSSKVLLCSHTIETENDVSRENGCFLISKELKNGEGINFVKYIACDDFKMIGEAEARKQKNSVSLKNIKFEGFSALIDEQESFLGKYWNGCRVSINGDDSLQQGLNYNMFQLLQSAGTNGKTNIAAKGLSGEGYGGHYFWDTEIYMFPFFLYTSPEIAKKLLEYRYFILEAARDRARQMSHVKGALYPWRTIGGEECSAYYPAGTAQYHINADIAHAVKIYYEATGDIKFMIDMGAEMVFETARIWMDIGHFCPNKFDQFCIDEVTGPDEYTALVNNNFYTNMMAKEHLEFAVEIAERIMSSYPVEYDFLKSKISLGIREVENWNKACENMYIPYDKNLKIHPQDDTFLDKKIWDFEKTPEENYPLLLHYHPLVIYRHQVCKQADVVLAEMLLGDRFSLDQKRRDFDYYEPITTHDSSLSKSIFSIMASEVGYYEKSYDFFRENVRMDLDNSHNNSQHGIHTASMGGSWMCLVYGFAGMRVYNGSLSFRPNLPRDWESFEFRINFGGQHLCVAVFEDRTEYLNEGCKPVEIFHFGDPFTIGPGEKNILK